MGLNAQTTVPTFTTGQVLTADQQNQSARTGVPVFAGTVERDAAFGGAGEKTLAEGQLCYLESTNVVQYYDGAAWATVGPSTSGVVQVKSTTKTDTFTMSSGTFADVTGLSVSITPTSASNNVLVMVAMYASSDDRFYARLMRDSTAIGLGDTAGSRVRVTGAVIPGASAYPEGLPLLFVDSPATTSATTYKVQIATTANAYVNRTVTDTDNNQFARGISTITVFEVTP